MTIAERILKVVEANGGNMSHIARELNVTPAYISKLKNQPDAVPSDLFIKSLCDKYKINETWLRTGEGDMLAPMTREQEIASITASIIKENNPIRIQLERIVCNLTDEQLIHIYEMAKELVEAVDKENLPE